MTSLKLSPMIRKKTTASIAGQGSDWAKRDYPLFAFKGSLKTLLSVEQMDLLNRIPLDPYWFLEYCVSTINFNEEDDPGQDFEEYFQIAYESVEPVRTEGDIQELSDQINESYLAMLEIRDRLARLIIPYFEEPNVGFIQRAFLFEVREETDTLLIGIVNE